jgi:hypothetical protein
MKDIFITAAFEMQEKQSAIEQLEKSEPCVILPRRN